MTRVYDPTYPRPLVTPQAEGETFCIYCQREYASPRRLRTHVLTKHEGTYRANAYAELSAGEWREATREEQTDT